MARRLVGGIRRPDESSTDVVREGLAAEQFLNLAHTHERFREELHFPGPVIDRAASDVAASGQLASAADRAHGEVRRLLDEDGSPPLDDELLAELADLAGAV